MKKEIVVILTNLDTLGIEKVYERTIEYEHPDVLATELEEIRFNNLAYDTAIISKTDGDSAYLLAQLMDLHNDELVDKISQSL